MAISTMTAPRIRSMDAIREAEAGVAATGVGASVVVLMRIPRKIGRARLRNVSSPAIVEVNGRGQKGVPRGLADLRNLGTVEQETGVRGHFRLVLEFRLHSNLSGAPVKPF